MSWTPCFVSWGKVTVQCTDKRHRVRRSVSPLKRFCPYKGACIFLLIWSPGLSTKLMRSLYFLKLQEHAQYKAVSNSLTRTEVKKLRLFCDAECIHIKQIFQYKKYKN